MRKIILSTVTMALIAASSSSQVFAGQSPHHTRKAALATSNQFRDVRNAVEPTPQPS